MMTTEAFAITNCPAFTVPAEIYFVYHVAMQRIGGFAATGRACGVSARTAARWARRKSVPRAEHVRALARASGVSIDAFRVDAMRWGQYCAREGRQREETRVLALLSSWR